MRYYLQRWSQYKYATFEMGSLTFLWRVAEIVLLSTFLCNDRGAYAQCDFPTGVGFPAFNDTHFATPDGTCEPRLDMGTLCDRSSQCLSSNCRLHCCELETTDCSSCSSNGRCLIRITRANLRISLGFMPLNLPGVEFDDVGDITCGSDVSGDTALSTSNLPGTEISPDK